MNIAGHPNESTQTTARPEPRRSKGMTMTSFKTKRTDIASTPQISWPCCIYRPKEQVSITLRRAAGHDTCPRSFFE